MNNDLPKISDRYLILFARVLYPGILITIFMYYHPNGLFKNESFEIIFYLFFGIMFYALYKGLLFFPIIRIIEIYIFKQVPQYKFHCEVADELGNGKLKKLSINSAIISHIITTKVNPFQRIQITKLNSYVHVLFMTFFLLIAFIIFNIMKPGLEQNWNTIMFIVAILFFIGGIGLDRIVDSRETIILKENREEYKKILREFKPK